MNSHPKPEGRRPKEIRDPKSKGIERGAYETRGNNGPDLFRAFDFVRNRHFYLLHRYGGFGFRIPAFWISDFGLRTLGPVLCGILPLIHLFAAQPLSDEALNHIRFVEKQNAQISLKLSFRDEQGKQVALAQYFGQKPVVLVMGYYECPMLCTLVLNGLMESAADMKWSIGREFDVIDVSINPHETPSLAAAKKRSYVQRYGRVGAANGWHFLTGSASASRQLADEVGFRYAYDPASKQYAHPSGLVILAPSGKVSGYLFGVAYPSRDLYGSLQRASQNQVSFSLRQFILLCFHYNPVTGKYSGAILMTLRLLGIGTVLGFGCFLWVLVRRGRATGTLSHPAEAKAAAASAVSAQVSKL